MNTMTCDERFGDDSREIENQRHGAITQDGCARKTG